MHHTIASIVIRFEELNQLKDMLHPEWHNAAKLSMVFVMYKTSRC